MTVLTKTQAVLAINKAINAGEEPRCICIIKDETTTPKKTHSQTLPSSTTIKQLFDEVAKKLHYVEKSFSIVFSHSSSSLESGKDIVLDKIVPSGTLSEMGFKDNRGKNYLHVLCADGIPPKPSHGPPITEYSSDEGTSTNWSYKQMVPPPPPPPPPPPTDSLAISGGPSVRRNALHDTTSFTFSESIQKAASKINHQETLATSSLVGLVNQAMTCYLNSLIQTLYMTPEFRNTLYEWTFEGTHDEGVTNIPYQLQRLFLALQTSKKQAVETTDLTKSFGWDSSEAWQQHDIQELCRVMFDALEKSFRETDQKDIIKQLYEGKMKDYVQCEECKNESAREDTYLDIPITIKPFGSSVAYKNVMEGLKAFVEPEKLDGSNQYFCGKCQKKCDAKKGLKFISFPYLLTLQLKRFDFDYTTMHRVKLNDRMFFPEELDLNSFLEQEKMKDTLSEPGSDCVEDGDATGDGLEIVGELRIDEEEGDYSSRDSGNDDDRPYSGDRSKRLVQHVSDDSEEGSSVDEGIDIESQKSYGIATPVTSGTGSSRCEEDGLGSGGSTPGAIGGKKEDWEGLPEACAINEFRKNKGSYVYELFSIMIHSGSAVGGHYYAYIKSFDDGQWYSFNDQIVSPILFEDIKKSYGGTLGRSSYYSSFSSSTNAYMLMYRQIDKTRNKEFIRTENLPSRIKAMKNDEKERENLARLRKEKERNMCSIKVYCNHPSLLQGSSQNIVYEHYEFMNTTTLQEAVEETHKLLKLDKAGIPCERCRLVKYDNYHQSLEESYDDDHVQQPLVELLGCARSSYLFDLLMETREENHDFEVYKPGGITVKVFSADYSKGCFRDPFIVRLMENDNVHLLKQILAKRLHYPLPRIRLAYEKLTSDVQLVTTNKVLKDFGHYRSIKVFVDVMSEEEFNEFHKSYPQGHTKNTSSAHISVRDTRLWTLVDRAAHIIHANIILPHDSPPYELVASRPSTPALSCSRSSTPSSIPSLVSIPSSPSAIDHSSEGAPVEPYDFAPLSDDTLRSCEERSGMGAETQGLETVRKRDTSNIGNRGDQTAEVNTDSAVAEEEIILFWKSPELANQSTSNTEDIKDKEYESPLPSLSLHLRRNSEEKGYFGAFESYQSLSAGDFQAELDRKFLAAGYSAKSPTSSLRCEDGSSNSETASLLSGEFDMQNDLSLPGNGATDSAGSCSTLDSTDTLCNSQHPDYYEPVHTKVGTIAPSLDTTLPSKIHLSTDNVYIENVTKDHTKRSALPGMAKQVFKDDHVDYVGAGDNNSDELCYYDDGRVDKGVSIVEGYDGSAELCHCHSKLVQWNTSAGEGDTGPSYLCSKCGRLKAESMFLIDGNVDKCDENTENADSLSECDPDSGEGLDHITPLFDESEDEVKKDTDSVMMEISFQGTSNCLNNTGARRRRTESSSSVLSDLGWGEQPLTQPCYFRVCAVSSNNEKCQVLNTQLDKRSTVGWLKRQLHPIIQVPTRQFSLYKVQQGGNQETELNSLNENFNHFRDEIDLKVKHERALRKNEHRCKIYRLLPGEVEPMKPLLDWVISKGLSIEESQHLLSEELSRQCKLLVEPEKIRLRNKCWRTPGRIFLSNEKFGIDITSSSEIFLEVLNKPELKTNHDQLAVYCRRWRPSTLTVEAFEEVILSPDEDRNHSVQELKKQISKISGITVEDIEWAKPRSMFPGHTSVLEVHEELEWAHAFIEYLHESSCNIADDGAVIFYRDKNEALKILSEQERSELKVKEDTRLAASKVGTSAGCSKNTGLYGRPYTRKEKALKIYTVDRIAKKKEATTTL